MHISTVILCWSAVAQTSVNMFGMSFWTQWYDQNKQLNKCSIVIRNCHIYRIAGNFLGKKLSWICEKYDIHWEKTFTDCSLLPHQRMAHPKIFWRKLSRIATKLWSFLPWKFPAIRCPCRLRDCYTSYCLCFMSQLYNSTASINIRHCRIHYTCIYTTQSS